MRLSKSLDLMAVRRSLTRPEEDSDEIERVLSRPGTLAGTFRLEFQPNSRPLHLYAFFSGQSPSIHLRRSRALPTQIDVSSHWGL